MIKNITGLIMFTAYFIFVMFLPSIDTHLAFSIIGPSDQSTSFLEILFVIPAWILLLPFFLKFQWVLILIPEIVILKKRKNPLLINWLTNFKMNIIIFCLGVLLETFIYLFFKQSIKQHFWSTDFYWMYTSFASNYIVICLTALWYSKTKRNYIKTNQY